MIRTDIETARSPLIIIALQKRDKHEVIAVAELNRSNAHMNDREQEEKRHDQ
jgi:hypothetical protein